MIIETKRRKSNKELIWEVLKKGLIDIVPIWILGIIFSNILSVPFESFQYFIATAGGGILKLVLQAVYSITFELQALFMVFNFCKHLYFSDDLVFYEKVGAVITVMCTFAILVGVPNASFEVYGTQGLIIAAISLCVSVYLYRFISEKTDAINDLFWDDCSLENNMRAMLSAGITLLIVCLLNFGILYVTKASNIASLIFYGITHFTNSIPNQAVKEVVLILETNLLWICGIHGGKVLEKTYYTTFMTDAAGSSPFFSAGARLSYMFIGGCGAAVCLVIALIISGRVKKHKFSKGERVMLFLSFFNMGEFTVFVLPVVFSKFFWLPFLTVPVIFYFTSYAAASLHLVPAVVNNVPWLMPVFANGFFATKSLGGLLLQVFNICIGTAIYLPFTLRYIDALKEDENNEYYTLLEEFKECEKFGRSIDLLSPYKSYAIVSKTIRNELKRAIDNEDLTLYYQPQYDSNNNCIGAEALLRFYHPQYGMIYPPLLLSFAKKDNLIIELDKLVLKKAMEDAVRFYDIPYMRGLKTSVNITGSSIQSIAFDNYLNSIAQEYDLSKLNICIEITEQDTLYFDTDMGERFRNYREMGYAIAIDDFSMGSTSAHYLVKDYFDILKIDGSLVRDIVKNERSQRVVAAIVDLAGQLNLSVIAEFVSSKEIKDELLALGCTLYQGYLYSPAVTVENYIDLCGRTVDVSGERDVEVNAGN